MRSERREKHFRRRLHAVLVDAFLAAFFAVFLCGAPIHARSLVNFSASAGLLALDRAGERIKKHHRIAFGFHAIGARALIKRLHLLLDRKKRIERRQRVRQRIDREPRHHELRRNSLPRTEGIVRDFAELRGRATKVGDLRPRDHRIILSDFDFGLGRRLQSTGLSVNGTSRAWFSPPFSWLCGRGSRLRSRCHLARGIIYVAGELYRLGRLALFLCHVVQRLSKASRSPQRLFEGVRAIPSRVREVPPTRSALCEPLLEVPNLFGRFRTSFGGSPNLFRRCRTSLRRIPETRFEVRESRFEVPELLWEITETAFRGSRITFSRFANHVSRFPRHGTRYRNAVHGQPASPSTTETRCDDHVIAEDFRVRHSLIGVHRIRNINYAVDIAQIELFSLDAWVVSKGANRVFDERRTRRFVMTI